MKALTKTLLAASISAAAMFATSASAATFNPFTVQPPGSEAFTADKMTGNYTEIATFDNDTNTFEVSLIWNATAFVTNGGTVPIDAAVTGLGNDYGMYALYKASGIFVTDGTATTFTFLPGSGSLSFYLDRNRDSVWSAPAVGGGDFSFINNDDDELLGSGDPQSGVGELNPGLSTCGISGGIYCGAFGASSTFALTELGESIFVSPSPFYNMTFQSGQLNNFSPTGTALINGSLDVVFDGEGEVPEPASVGLLGLGLLGLAAARRRAKQQG